MNSLKAFLFVLVMFLPTPANAMWFFGRTQAPSVQTHVTAIKRATALEPVQKNIDDLFAMALPASAHATEALQALKNVAETATVDTLRAYASVLDTSAQIMHLTKDDEVMANRLLKLLFLHAVKGRSPIHEIDMSIEDRPHARTLAIQDKTSSPILVPATAPTKAIDELVAIAREHSDTFIRKMAEIYDRCATFFNAFSRPGLKVSEGMVDTLYEQLSALAQSPSEAAYRPLYQAIFAYVFNYTMHNHPEPVVRNRLTALTGTVVTRKPDTPSRVSHKSPVRILAAPKHSAKKPVVFDSPVKVVFEDDSDDDSTLRKPSLPRKTMSDHAPEKPLFTHKDSRFFPASTPAAAAYTDPAHHYAPPMPSHAQLATAQPPSAYDHYYADPRHVATAPNPYHRDAQGRPIVATAPPAEDEVIVGIPLEFGADLGYTTPGTVVMPLLTIQRPPATTEQVLATVFRKVAALASQGITFETVASIRTFLSWLRQEAQGKPFYQDTLFQLEMACNIFTSLLAAIDPKTTEPLFNNGRAEIRRLTELPGRQRAVRVTSVSKPTKADEKIFQKHVAKLLLDLEGTNDSLSMIRRSPSPQDLITILAGLISHLYETLDGSLPVFEKFSLHAQDPAIKKFLEATLWRLGRKVNMILQTTKRFMDASAPQEQVHHRIIKDLIIILRSVIEDTLAVPAEPMKPFFNEFFAK